MMEAEAPPYGFAAEPQVVSSKPKYKDPYSSKDMEGPPSNIMYDRRIHRGNTYASMVIQAPGQQEPTATTGPGAGRGRGKKVGGGLGGMKQRIIAGVQERGELRTPTTPSGRTHMQVQTDNLVEELSDKPPAFEMAAQSDFYIDRPPTPLFVPVKLGEDKETQIYAGDVQLFNFSLQAEPILEVLCMKTMEQAQMEVLEEEEIAIIRKQAKEYEHLKNSELAQAKRMEDSELRRLQENERRKVQQKAQKNQNVLIHQKLISGIMARDCLRDLRTNSLVRLKDMGVFRSSMEFDIYMDLLPWMFSQVKELQSLEANYDNIFNTLIVKGMATDADIHAGIVRAHHEAIENEKYKMIRELEEKEQIHLERKQARTERRKIASIEALREELKTDFLKGEEKWEILNQDFADVNGQYMTKPIVGVVGGVFTELINVLTTISELLEKPKFFTDKIMMTFLGNYLTTHMRSEAFYFTVGQSLLQYLSENGADIQKINTMDKEQNEIIGQHIKSHQDGDPILDMIVQNATEFGLSSHCVERLSHSIYRIIVKKAEEPETFGRTEAAREKIKLVKLPEEVKQDKFNASVILRVRFPVKEKLETEELEDHSISQIKTPKSSKKGSISMNTSNPPQHLTTEAQYEDRIQCVIPQGSQREIFILHQAGGIELRRDIARFAVKQYKEQLGEIPLKDVIKKVDEKAEHIETLFLSKFANLPTFDIEFN